MDDEEIARYKIIELGRKIDLMENFLPALGQMLSDVEKQVEEVGAARFWRAIEPMLQLVSISIRKPSERITTVDKLEWLEVLKRFNYRSCGDPICIVAPHCTDCGLHGSRKDDGHNCEILSLNEK